MLLFLLRCGRYNRIRRNPAMMVVAMVVMPMMVRVADNHCGRRGRRRISGKNRRCGSCGNDGGDEE